MEKISRFSHGERTKARTNRKHSLGRLSFNMGFIPGNLEKKKKKNPAQSLRDAVTTAGLERTTRPDPAKPDKD